MPKLKQPLKLEVLSMKLVANYFQESFTNLETLKSGDDISKASEEILSKEIQTQLEGIPGPILEIVLIEVIHRLLVEIISRKTTKGLIEALEQLLRPSLKSVDLGKMFYGARLPRKITQPCEEVLPKKLMHMIHLCELDLISRCTDDILSTLARCCPSLKKLNISYSDLVTDSGLRYLCGLPEEKGNTKILNGCKEIEWLGLQKLWETTADGVRAVIENLPKLKYLRYDQFGDIFTRMLDGSPPSHSTSKIPKRHKEYGLTLFDQTYTVFTPSDELIHYVAECCPHIRILKIYAPDKFLPCFCPLNKVERFALEIDGPCGPGLISYLNVIGVNLVIINISFDFLESRHLIAIGKCCPKVKELTLMGSEISEDVVLKNENYFTEMEVFKMSVWSDEGITASLLLYFFSYSRELRELTITASAVFLNDNFFQHQILVKCPLSKLEELCIQGNPRVPLTLKTARKLLSLCPNLKKLGLSRWRVLESAIKNFQKEMISSNYDIMII